MWDFGKFFQTLRSQKYILYVPERIYRAHRAGLLHGFGGRYRNRRKLFELLHQVGAGIKIPLSNDEATDYIKEQRIAPHCASHIALYEKAEECPSLPEWTVASDAFWDLFRERFGIPVSGMTGPVTNRTITWEKWVYQVRFFSIWVAVAEPSPGLMPRGLSPSEKKKWHRQAREMREKRRILRKDYGLTGEYFGHNNTRRAWLVVLKKAYPPEQVQHLRRQIEDRLRKDPAEVIRCAIQRSMIQQ